MFASLGSGGVFDNVQLPPASIDAQILTCVPENPAASSLSRPPPASTGRQPRFRPKA